MSLSKSLLSITPLAAQPGVSVIVCCYNSQQRLPETLKYLSQQNVQEDINWEIIIVNNASTDGTAQTAISEWSGLGGDKIGFKLIDQPIPGLSHAREKGVAEAKYECLIFCDDDNWLFEDYVQNAFNALNNWPTAGAVGATGIAKPEGQVPAWFEYYNTLYALGIQNDFNGVISRNSPYVYGAGMVVRKSIFCKLADMNFTFRTIGRQKGKLSSGEDVELCFAIKLLGYDIAYTNELKFYHFISANRLTDKYLLDLMYQLGCCDIFHRPYYWLSTPNLKKYKKTWFWVLLISIHLYSLSLIRSFKKSNLLDSIISRVNMANSKGRLLTIIKLTSSVNDAYREIKTTFKIT